MQENNGHLGNSTSAPQKATALIGQSHAFSCSPALFVIHNTGIPVLGMCPGNAQANHSPRPNMHSIPNLMLNSKDTFSEGSFKDELSNIFIPSILN